MRTLSRFAFGRAIVVAGIGLLIALASSPLMAPLAAAAPSLKGDGF